MFYARQQAIKPKYFQGIRLYLLREAEINIGGWEGSMLLSLLISPDEVGATAVVSGRCDGSTLFLLLISPDGVGTIVVVCGSWEESILFLLRQPATNSNTQTIANNNVLKTPLVRISILLIKQI